MVSIEYLKNKNILVFGMGNTGLATVRKLKKKIKIFQHGTIMQIQEIMQKKNLIFFLIRTFIKIRMILL